MAACPVDAETGRWLYSVKSVLSALPLASAVGSWKQEDCGNFGPQIFIQGRKKGRAKTPFLLSGKQRSPKNPL